MKKLLVVFLFLAMPVFAQRPLPPTVVSSPKAYIAKLSQGSGDPTVDVELENSLGVVTYSRIEEGRFRMSCAGCFPDELKISGLREFQFTDTNGKFRLEWDDEGGNGDSLILETRNIDNQLSDNILSLTEVRIVVYP